MCRQDLDSCVELFQEVDDKIGDLASRFQVPKDDMTGMVWGIGKTLGKSAAILTPNVFKSVPMLTGFFTALKNGGSLKGAGDFARYVHAINVMGKTEKVVDGIKLGVQLEAFANPMMKGASVGGQVLSKTAVALSCLGAVVSVVDVAYSWWNGNPTGNQATKIAKDLEDANEKLQKIIKAYSFEK